MFGVSDLDRLERRPSRAESGQVVAEGSIGRNSELDIVARSCRYLHRSVTCEDFGISESPSPNRPSRAHGVVTGSVAKIRGYSGAISSICPVIMSMAQQSEVFGCGEHR
jgi:hypothetical protein